MRGEAGRDKEIGSISIGIEKKLEGVEDKGVEVTDEELEGVEHRGVGEEMENEVLPEGVELRLEEELLEETLPDEGGGEEEKLLPDEEDGEVEVR